MKYDMQLADYVNLLANYEKATLDITMDKDDVVPEEDENESGWFSLATHRHVSVVFSWTGREAVL